MRFTAYFRAASSGKAPELCIYDEVGPSPFAMNPVTLAGVRECLNEIGDAPELTVRINSVGGSVTEGMAIYAALREFAGVVNVVVEGLAASIASVIAMSGKTVTMTAGSYMMVHNPFAVAQGEASDLRRTADLLDKMRADMLAIYAAKTGMATADLEALVDAETYLSADEAVKLGFADRVSDTGARIAASAVKLLNKPPEALKRAALAKESPMTEEEMKKMKADLAAAQEECKSLKAELEKFKKSDDSGDEDEDEDSTTGDGEDAKASVHMARIVMAVAAEHGEQDLAKLAEIVSASPSAKGSRKDVVRAAIASGKITPALKAWATSCPRAVLDDFLRAAPHRGPGAPAMREPAPPAATGAVAGPTEAELRVARAMASNKTPEVQLKRATDARAIALPGIKDAG